MEPTYVILLLVLVVAMVSAFAIRFAGEYQRFAVFVLGRFAGLKGPGLILRWPGGMTTWIRLSVGDAGELISPDVGRFSGVELPVVCDARLQSGSPVRISGFSSDEVEVQAAAETTRIVKCEQCGHEMIV